MDLYLHTIASLDTLIGLASAKMELGPESEVPVH